MNKEEFCAKTQEDIDFEIEQDISDGLFTETVNTYFDEHKIGNPIQNGIIDVKYGNNIYKIWNIKHITQQTIDFLKNNYPNSLILPEINHIDFTIFDNNSDDIIPIEIQKTPLMGASHKFSHAQYENLIRKQIEDNIENYEKC